MSLLLGRCLAVVALVVVVLTLPPLECPDGLGKRFAFDDARRSLGEHSRLLSYFNTPRFADHSNPNLSRILQFVLHL